VLEVYKDTMGLMTCYYTLPLALSLPYLTGRVKGALDEGIGILAFIAVFGFLPEFALRYYRAEPLIDASGWREPQQVVDRSERREAEVSE
jgi:hypothetical protein